MGFLDFITKPRFSATPTDPLSVTPYEQPAATYGNDGLLSAVPELAGMAAPQQMNQMPDLEEKPSILSGVWDYLKSPQNLAALGGALKNYSGGEGGVEQAMAIGEQRRGEARQNAAMEKAKADLARKNAAFKAAYVNGRFDPQAYLAAMGGEGDMAEGFSLAAKLAPEGGVDGGTAWTRDPLTGETTWGERRGPSHGEELADERNDETAQYREIMLELRRQAEERMARQGDARIGLSRQREGRISSGGGGGGHGPVPALPAGFVIEK